NGDSSPVIRGKQRCLMDSSSLTTPPLSLGIAKTPYSAHAGAGTPSCGGPFAPRGENSCVNMFGKKMLLGGLAFGLAMAVMVGALSEVYSHNRTQRASESIWSQAESTDKHWVAEAFEDRCTEPGEWLAHVNLRRKGDPIRLNYWHSYASGVVNRGEVFLIEQ